MLAETALLQATPAIGIAEAQPFARVEVHWGSASVLEPWAELERSAPCSIYQTRAWLLPWIETLGLKAGIKPFFVVARGADERCVALLCLGLSRRGPLRIATWLGGKDSNFNMPLARDPAAWTYRSVAALLRKAARACGRDKPDIFVLENQPFAWGGKPNPLALLPHRPAPSSAYAASLPKEIETFFARRLSKETRKKLRKKETKLAALGALTHLVASTRAEQQRVIDTFIAQKVARFREKKIVSTFATPEMRAFIETASRPAGAGIELHALLVGERIVAVYGGASHDGQWSGMFNAFDGDEEVARSSPGDLLLMRIMAKACADGMSRLDLGIGESRYKSTFCDEELPLFDAFVPTGALGAVAARGLMLRQVAKRAIKKNPRLLARLRGAQRMFRWRSTDDGPASAPQATS